LRKLIKLYFIIIYSTLYIRLTAFGVDPTINKCYRIPTRSLRDEARIGTFRSILPYVFVSRDSLYVTHTVTMYRAYSLFKFVNNRFANV
jgi:hypothetical protein